MQRNGDWHSKAAFWRFRQRLLGQPKEISNATKRGLAQQSSILEVSSKIARPAQRNQQCNETGIGTAKQHFGGFVKDCSASPKKSAMQRNGDWHSKAAFWRFRQRLLG